MLDSLIEIITLVVRFKRIELNKKGFEYKVKISKVDGYRYLGEEVKEALEKLGYSLRIPEECGTIVIMDGDVVKDTREECVRAKVLPTLLAQMDNVFDVYGRREGGRG